jgi:hypothetical protein
MRSYFKTIYFKHHKSPILFYNKYIPNPYLERKIENIQNLNLEKDKDACSREIKKRSK